MPVGRKITSWTRLPSAERLSAMEAVALLSICKLFVVVMAFRLYLPFLRRASARTAAPAGIVREVRLAVDRAAGALPWRPACLDRAMAARFMLARRGFAAALHLGVKRGEGGLQAHAWVISGERVVVGAVGREGMVEVVRFGGAEAGRANAGW